MLLLSLRSSSRSLLCLTLVASSSCGSAGSSCGAEVSSCSLLEFSVIPLEVSLLRDASTALSISASMGFSVPSLLAILVTLTSKEVRSWVPSAGEDGLEVETGARSGE